MKTYITFEQLKKAKRPMDLFGREIFLLNYGGSLPITKYLIWYWQRREKWPHLDEHRDLLAYLELIRLNTSISEIP